MILRNLQIILDPGRLEAGSHATVGPLGTLQRVTALCDLAGGQDFGNVQQHLGSPAAGQNLAARVNSADRAGPTMMWPGCSESK
jgi:hypothetical protein